MGYYSETKKKKGNPTICDNMDEPGGLNEISQMERNEHSMVTYMWNLKKKERKKSRFHRNRE